MGAEDLRTCHKCGESKPLSGYYATPKRGVMYHQHTCKACTIAADALRRIARQEGKKLARMTKEEGPYPWPPLTELDRLGMKLWGFAARTGQLRPIVKVELEAAA